MLKLLHNVIRQRLWDERNLGELARDVQRGFDSVLPGEVREFTDTFKKPMFLRKLAASPVEIRAARVLIDASPETLVTPGHVHFAYLGGDQGARINDIAGLTEGVRYRFTFVVTYA